MVLTQVNRDAAGKLIENKPNTDDPSFPTKTRQWILNSTVRLNGSGGFIGSGVIINVSGSKTTILTAVHNVGTWSKGDVTDLNGFKTNVKVWYGNGDKDLTFNAKPGSKEMIAKLSDVALPAGIDLCEERASCMYDLLVLTSTDQDLKQFATDRVFGGKTDVLEDVATAIVKNFDSLLDRRRYYLVQLGYGDITDERNGEVLDEDRKIKKLKTDKAKCRGAFEEGTAPKINCLHYRLSQAHMKATRSHFNQEGEDGADPAYTEFTESFRIAGDATSSTAQGDSGGPLYAVDKKTLTNFYLVGVTTGADMYSAKRTNPWTFFNNISTSVLPYMKTKAKKDDEEGEEE